MTGLLETALAKSAALGLWRRQRRLIIAVGAVPVLLVLAVLGAGWSVDFPTAEPASGDSKPSGTGSASDLNLWPLAVFGLLALCFLAFILLRHSGWIAGVAVALVALVFVIIGLIGGSVPRGGETSTSGPTADGEPTQTAAASSPTWKFVAASVGIAIIGAALAKFGSSEEEETAQDEIAEALDEIAGHLDLATGTPRQNIISMYAALEDALASEGKVRHGPETTAEFSLRVLQDLGGRADSCAKLAMLYQDVAFGESAASLADQSLAGDLVRSIGVDLAAASTTGPNLVES